MAPPQGAIDITEPIKGKVPKPGHSEPTEAPYEYPEWYAKKDVHSKSLEDQSNCASDWLLSYLSPLLRLGSQKVLEIGDIGVPSRQDRASAAFETIVASWAKEVSRTNAINQTKKSAYDSKFEKLSDAKKLKSSPFVKTQPNVARSLLDGFGACKVWLGIAFYVIAALIQFIPVLILEDLVKYFEGKDTEDPHKTLFHPWILVAILGALPFSTSILQTRSQVIFQHLAVFARTAISTLLYKKSLNVSAAGRSCTNTGQVVNMMSNDTTQLQRFIQFGGMTLVAPLQIIISLILIYRQVGPATWVGVGFMVILAPVNIIVFGVVGKMRRKVLKYSDLRVKMMNEILAGIRIIKFYAWEKPFQKEVSDLREKELWALTMLAYVSAVGFSLILLSAPIIQPILVFLTYIRVQDKPLSASTAFTTVALFNIMRFPFAFLPMGILQFIQSRISLRRLGNYLQLPELEKYVISEPDVDDLNVENSSSAPVSVMMKNCSFSWTNHKANLTPIDSSGDKKKKRRGSNASASSDIASSVVGSTLSGANEEPLEDVETLRNISVTINEGELVAVVGSVGSGKSSFLSAILGEMEPMNGSTVHVPRALNQVDEANFVSYCSQSPWVVNDTLRGNVLFGRDFDQRRYDEVIDACALLDDLAVLPAGDSTEIGERGINLSGGQKARVSLARALYAKNTKLILLDDPLSAVDAHVGEHLFKNALTGKVSKGTTRILVTHHVHFLPKCDKVIVLEGGEATHIGTYAELVANGVDFAGAIDFVQKMEVAADGEEDEAEAKVEKKVDGANDTAAMKKKGENLTTKEEREEGSVDSKAYIHYAKSGGVAIFFSLFFIQGVGRASEIGSAFWLAHWAKNAIEASFTGNGLSDKSTTYFLNIYAAFGMIGVLCLTVRSVFMAMHRLRASRTLHNNLTASIMRAPVSFFDGKYEISFSQLISSSFTFFLHLCLYSYSNRSCIKSFCSRYGQD
jgi:ATP-binding cassette subfamily C (CFTR/MRP) protein 1